MAQQASQRGDVATVESALSAAVRSPRWSWPTDALVPTLLAHARFTALPPPQQSELLLQLQSGGVSTQLSLDVLLRQHACGAAALADAPRRARCEALVERVLADSPNLLEFSLAANWAARIGWPAERVRALQDEKLALQQVRATAFDARQMFSCDGVRRLVDDAAQRAAHGETGAARRAIDGSGRPLAAWAAEARAEAAKRDAAFLGTGVATPQR